MEEGLRAARCTAPTVGNELFRGTAGGSWTRPYGECGNGCVLLVGAGPRPARPDSHRERWFGKRRRGFEPQLF